MNRAFDERADEALHHLRHLEWSDARRARVRRGMFRKQRRRRVQRAAGATAVAMAAALVAVFVTTRPASGPAVATNVPVHAPAPFAVGADGVIRFTDGSTATPASADALLRVERHAERSVEVGLLAGAARFEVTPGRDRRFTVQAGAARVEVLGTAFEVERGEGEVRVAVTHGVVRVAWDGGHHTLRRGEAGTFPPATEPVEAAASARAEPRTRRVRSAAPDWRALAEAGELEEAYAALGGVRPTAADLWAAADVARRAGHPAEAVPYLEQLLEVAPRSRQAQNAAFSLGRVLGGLGRHGDAAAAYGEAAERSGSLREAALYRQVQALRASGQAAAAEARAGVYRERFPDGRFTSRLD